MTDYTKMYAEKLTTADELAARVESGWSIGMDTSVSAAPAIVSAIARRAADGALDGLTVQTILDAYPFEFYADESLRGKMTGMSWFSGGGARRAINGGWADILPAYYRDIPKLIRENYEYDVVLLSVSPEHLGLYCLPGISTRYRDREASVQAVSDALAALARAKVGNYLAFFPSYAYLRQVHEDFTARYPDIGTLAQESGLDDAARAAFLEQFGPSPAKTLLGFGVMGGIFGEGVDLVGDRLIGCAIVGVGLPQVNPRQEILRRYYDEAGGTGFDYAYRFPGMNKVLQAAGRVIRTQEDRGVVLLLDDRFARGEYTRLFPRHWHQLQYLRSTTELEQQLAAFWARNQ